MVKRQAKQTPIQALDERLQLLNKKRLQAYNANVSYEILEQLDRMIAETELDLYTESELQRHRNTKNNDDGEEWIV